MSFLYKIKFKDRFKITIDNFTFITSHVNTNTYLNSQFANFINIIKGNNSENVIVEETIILGAYCDEGDTVYQTSLNMKDNILTLTFGKGTTIVTYDVNKNNKKEILWFIQSNQKENGTYIL